MPAREQRKDEAVLAARASPTIAVVTPPRAPPLPERQPALSIVAPCFNEADALPAFLERMLAAATAACGEDFELILVNDGSRDATWALIQAKARATTGVVGVNLARNHGHQLAVTAGLGLARGERVLIIDADLQDPPELLSEMMRRMDEGFDVVYGRRRKLVSKNLFKLATASAPLPGLLSAIAEVDIPRDAGDFRLMSRRIVERLNAMPEQDRFPPRRSPGAGRPARASCSTTATRGTPARPAPALGRDDPAGCRRRLRRASRRRPCGWRA